MSATIGSRALASVLDDRSQAAVLLVCRAAAGGDRPHAVLDRVALQATERS